MFNTSSILTSLILLLFIACASTRKAISVELPKVCNLENAKQVGMRYLTQANIVYVDPIVILGDTSIIYEIGIVPNIPEMKGGGMEFAISKRDCRIITALHGQ